MDAYRRIAPPGRRASRTVAAGAVAVFVTAALIAAVLAHLDRRAPATVSPPARPHTGLGARPEPWPQESAGGARAELEFTRRDDLAALDLRGQYAAELAAPPAGRSDPAAVLAEHQRLRRGIASDEHQVVLLRDTDLAHPADRAGAWLTVALGDFPDGPAVTAWCRTIAAQHCVPRRLDPPR
ncbi:hypothetical protein [Actinoplanes teichomyceticus]|uniref:Uncharacterized protein n=1 Tax=Actinoplanes teichomyceticus TaxID=1867 RepID=A0A561W9W6_ACTTI|nr:hypothetical protein [Actinoplanes teichomyceticus]TWG20650.1 hypothetical protein FHX34_103179 [Actinoplanes teichomyceticus]GIF14305.1 hypothetical protein Ate01nite_43370 [Actinoplanes teichomyceticus]